MRLAKFFLSALAVLIVAPFCPIQAQNSLYPNRFNLQEVTLLDSPFKTAQDLNYQTLMNYDVERMLTPYIRQAGLSQTTDEHSKYYQWEYEHPGFDSFAWNPQMAMDGHILGHYLSALSISYASCHDEAQRARFKERIELIISVLNDCQKVWDNDSNGMKGFLGGIPDNSIWTSLLDADYRVYNQHGNWVPFYCEHKIMAGLRDAFVYAGNQQAKEMFRKLCDWTINVVSLFTDDIMEMQILQWETGSMNEVLADASQIFGDSKYMKGAQKFTHKIVIENMNADPQHEFLNKKHANELTSLFLGAARINELKHENRYFSAARLYWEDVNRRASAIGGVGVASYFQPEAKSSAYITDGDGPEFCTTYNMLKLTEQLFASSRAAKYSDYYERALLNHVLASIDPETGGYTYFTSLRPESHRIYSRVNEAMWCCVGTGMESHSKYADFIYTLSQDTLFVNLFIASELKNDRVALRQESSFPYGTQSKITVQKNGNYQIAVRHPSWATKDFSVKVNGKEAKYKPEQVTPGNPSYISCGKSWKAGDVIEITYPMTLTYTACPGNSDYIALRWGPNVLAAQTSSANENDPLYENLFFEYAHEGMNDFSPQSKIKFNSLAFAPMLICDRSAVPSRVRRTDESKLYFEIDASATGSKWKTVRMMPFFALHHARYAIYWNHQSEAAWLRNPLFKDQLRKAEMEALTYDMVIPGDNNSENAHKMRISKTGSRGNLNGKPFRDAQPGEWFEYNLSLEKASADISAGKDAALVCRLSLTDKGRSCNISVDGKVIKTFEVPMTKTGVGKDKFFDEVFIIPASTLKGRKNATIRFESNDGSFVPRVYQASLMRYDDKILK
ncbi:MAG: glycoside hydrolase family 127 protein [Bacteroidales bacterium]|nr:glycoside hydrolase family 127 protein [Candidatus Liminaster caballi]